MVPLLPWFMMAALHLVQGLLVWPHSALHRNRHSLVNYGNFTIDSHQRLSVIKVSSHLVHGALDCIFSCISEPNCYSFNLAVRSDSYGRRLCELLPIDKYSSPIQCISANVSFHHYSPWSPCQRGPCQNLNKHCYPDFVFNSYRCGGHPGIYGDHCEQQAKSCSELKLHSPQTTSGFYVIDPDGKGGYNPITVFCNMTSTNGVGVTVVGHDSENKTLVSGYESRGSYVRNVSYLGDGLIVQQLANLVDLSAHCWQFIKYLCQGSRLLNNGKPFGWWLSRNLTTMTYWGGATPANSYKCACGVNNSCANDTYGCNCDKNDRSWLADWGFLTEKSQLPVLQLRFGDTGGQSEKGYHTLGKLKCFG